MEKLWIIVLKIRKTHTSTFFQQWTRREGVEFPFVLYASEINVMVLLTKYLHDLTDYMSTHVLLKKCITTSINPGDTKIKSKQCL